MRSNIASNGQDFSAVVEEIPSSSSYLFFTDDGGAGPRGGYTITAACRSSMTLLGLDALALRSQVVSMTRYLPETKASVNRIRAEGGMVVQLHNASTFDDDENDDGDTHASMDDGDRDDDDDGGGGNSSGGSDSPSSPLPPRRRRYSATGPAARVQQHLLQRSQHQQQHDLSQPFFVHACIQRVIVPMLDHPLLIMRCRMATQAEVDAATATAAGSATDSTAQVAQPQRATECADHERTTSPSRLESGRSGVTSGSQVHADPGGSILVGKGHPPLNNAAGKQVGVNSSNSMDADVSLCPFGGGRYSGVPNPHMHAHPPITAVPVHPSSSASAADFTGVDDDSSARGNGVGGTVSAGQLLFQHGAGGTANATATSVANPIAAAAAAGTASLSSLPGQPDAAINGATSKAASPGLAPSSAQHASEARRASTNDHQLRPIDESSAAHDSAFAPMQFQSAKAAPASRIASGHGSAALQHLGISTRSIAPGQGPPAALKLTNTPMVTSALSHVRLLEQQHEAFAFPATESASSSSANVSSFKPGGVARIGSKRRSGVTEHHTGRNSSTTNKRRASVLAAESAARCKTRDSDRLDTLSDAGSGHGHESYHGWTRAGPGTVASALGGKSRRGSASFTSKGSANTSLVSPAAALRRGMHSKAGVLESSLVLLKWAVIVVLSVTSCLALASMAMTVSLTSELIANVALVGLNGRRGVYLQQIFSHTQNAVLGAGEGKLSAVNNEAAAVFTNMTLLQGVIQRPLERFLAIHRQLYLALDGTSQREAMLYAVPTIPVYDLIPGTFVDTSHSQNHTRHLGLSNAGIELHEKASRAIFSLDGRQFTWNDSDVYFVLVNGPNEIRKACNDSLMLADDRSSTQADTMHFADLVLLTVSEGVALLVSLAVMIPAIRSVMAAKSNIFSIILDVPLPIIRALKGRVARRLQAAAHADDDIDASMFGLGYDGASGEVVGITMMDGVALLQALGQAAA